MTRPRGSDQPEAELKKLMKTKLIKLMDGQWVEPAVVRTVEVLPGRDGQMPCVMVKTSDGWIINVMTGDSNPVAAAERIAREVNEACVDPEPVLREVRSR